VGVGSRGDADGILERHDSILRPAIDGHDGCVFSTGADGFAAAFACAADGMSAAVSARQALGFASTGVELFDERAGRWHRGSRWTTPMTWRRWWRSAGA